MKTKKLIILLLVVVLTASAAATLASCGEPEAPERVYFETTRTYYVDDFTILEFGSVPMLVVDRARSFVRFGDDGSFTLRIVVSKDGIGLVNSMLASGAIDFETLDLDYILDTYLAAMFPGFNRRDFQGSLKLASDSMGLRFVGADTPEGNALFDKLEAGDFEGLEIPSPFGLEITSVYRLKTVHSDYSGDWQAAFIGNYDETVTPNPYSIFTFKKNDEGKDIVYTIVEILNARLEGTLREANDYPR